MTPPTLPSPLTFHLIPHTHWDREWYLTRAAFQARLVPVLDEVLDQLDRNSDARFVLDGQTVLLDDYLAARPDQESRIAALVRRGVLEIGPWYVLADLLVPGAASLRRNLAEGRRDARRYGGRMDVLYSPDAFGHPAALPALAAEHGIRWAVVRRGLGRPDHRDRDLYRWESPGGESLLVYHLPAGGYDIAIDLAGPGQELSRQWSPVRQELTSRAASDQIAVFLGADHHAMARDVVRLRDRLQALERGHRVRVSSLTEFFEAVEQRTPSLSTIRGELRRIDGHAWILQGVHSTRARMKRRHSCAELWLSRVAEPLALRAAENGGHDRGGLLGLAWRMLLQCQFHDTLAGTTSDGVQREQEVRLDAVDALLGEIAGPSLAELAGRSAARTLVLWNPSTRARAGIVTSGLTFFRRDVLVGPRSGRTERTGPGHQPFALVHSSGRAIPVQVLGVRQDQERVDSMRHYPDQDVVDRVWVAFVTPRTAGQGTSLLEPRPSGLLPTEDHGLEVRRGFLENAHVAIRISSLGVLRVTDKHTGQEYRGLAELEDQADRGDTYTFSASSGTVARGGTAVSSRILAAGPLVGAIEVRWSMKSAGLGRIEARLVVVLHTDSPVVRLRFDIENLATGHRLRARFPVGAGTASLAGAALGVERRGAITPDEDPGAIEQPVLTAPAQRFVAAGEGPRGLAVLAPGFFEYEWTAHQELLVTLLRSIGELSKNDLAERPGHAAWPEPTPMAEEPGTHTIELAFAAGDATAERLEEQWEDVFLPVLSVFRRNDRP